MAFKIKASSFVAAYLLYKAITGAMGYTGPLDEVTKKAPPELAWRLIFKQTAGLAALLLGITVVARIPRLTRSALLRAISFAIAGLGAFAYILSVRHDESTRLRDLPLPRVESRSLWPSGWYVWSTGRA